MFRMVIRNKQKEDALPLYHHLCKIFSAEWFRDMRPYTQLSNEWKDLFVFICTYIEVKELISYFLRKYNLRVQ